MVTLRAAEEVTAPFPLIDVPVPIIITVAVPGFGARELELLPHEVVRSMLAPRASNVIAPQTVLLLANRLRAKAINKPASVPGITRSVAVRIELLGPGR